MVDFEGSARHVVKLSNGSYVSRSSLLESTHHQVDAHRWLTWASAKLIAECPEYKGLGARAVRLTPVAWCALTLEGKLVLMGTSRRQAKELWRPEHNRHVGTRLVAYTLRKEKGKGHG